MYYLCLAFTVCWLVNFLYLIFLHSQSKDIRRRLDARTSMEPQGKTGT